MVVLMNEVMIKCLKHLTKVKDNHFSNYGSKKWIDSKLMSLVMFKHPMLQYIIIVHTIIIHHKEW